MAFDFKGGSTPPKPGDSVRSNSNYSSSANSASRSSGGSAVRPQGFQNRPVIKKTEDSYSPSRPVPSSSNGRRSDRYTQRRPVQRRTYAPVRGFQIPWNIVLPILGVIMAVVLCWVFRDEITAFLSQVLSWIITILIIIFLVKFFIFRR